VSNLNSRVKTIEKEMGIHDRNKYMCLVYSDEADFRSVEEKAQGYKIQPFDVAYGGNGGDVFYLATPEELAAFGARPDVDLTVICVGYEQDRNPFVELGAKIK
jgi:hypothetical protein